ncbi:MAG: ABC transporter ATP-binding protein [Chloroflexi bacterium]|nr:ABC transporter ATP-binding protein [Chloroflexota bacterium]
MTLHNGSFRANGEAHLSIAQVSKGFVTPQEELIALQDITLEVGRGEFISILGPSGCGKSTLLRIIGGLLEPTSGSVAVNGRSPREAQADKALGFVFQEPSLLPWRTVVDNICLPLEVNNRHHRDTRYTTEGMLSLVGLGRFRNYYPFQLSGGMQQRVALARALAFDPALLLMDEPFGALDEITRATMRYELLRIWDREKKTVVFVTHSIIEAIILSDRVAVLSSQPGRIKTVVDINLPRPRSEGLERGEAFLDYSNLLHSLLMGGVKNGANFSR